MHARSPEGKLVTPSRALQERYLSCGEEVEGGRTIVTWEGQGREQKSAKSKIISQKVTHAASFFGGGFDHIRFRIDLGGSSKFS
jgi:hypothetical protein